MRDLVPPFATLMEGDDERFHQQFIKTAGTAAHLLYNRRQVNDIKSFCTVFSKSSVLSVDVTFKLGPFWAVVKLTIIHLACAEADGDPQLGMHFY